MSEENNPQATNPSEGTQGASPTATAPATPKANPRPHKDADLGVLEEEMVAVTLREQYTIPRDGHKKPHEGPKKLNMPLSDANTHAIKLQEFESIRDRWKAIQDEKEVRRAERNLAGDINKPAAKA